MEDFDSIIEQRGQANKIVASALNDEDFDSRALDKIRAQRQRVSDMESEVTSSITSRRNRARDQAVDFQVTIASVFFFALRCTHFQNTHNHVQFKKGRFKYLA